MADGSRYAILPLNFLMSDLMSLGLSRFPFEALQYVVEPTHYMG